MPLAAGRGRGTRRGVGAARGRSGQCRPPRPWRRHRSRGRAREWDRGADDYRVRCIARRPRSVPARPPRRLSRIPARRPGGWRTTVAGGHPAPPAHRARLRWSHGWTHAPPPALANALAVLPADAPVVFTIDERWMQTDTSGGIEPRLSGCSTRASCGCCADPASSTGSRPPASRSFTSSSSEPAGARRYGPLRERPTERAAGSAGRRLLRRAARSPGLHEPVRCSARPGDDRGPGRIVRYSIERIGGVGPCATRD